MFKALIVVAICIGLLLGGLSITSEDMDTAINEVEQDFRSEGGWLGGLSLLFLWVMALFVNIGLSIGNALGHPLAYYLALFAVFAYVLWYPVTWLSCMFGILIKDKFRRRKEDKA